MLPIGLGEGCGVGVRHSDRGLRLGGAGLRVAGAASQCVTFADQGPAPPARFWSRRTGRERAELISPGSAAGVGWGACRASRPATSALRPRLTTALGSSGPVGSGRSADDGGSCAWRWPSGRRSPAAWPPVTHR